MNSSRRKLSIVVVLLLFAVCGAVVQVATTVQAYTSAQRHLASLESLAGDPEALLASPQALMQARVAIRALSANLAHLRRTLIPLRIARPLASRTPVLGYDLASAPVLVDRAAQDVQAASHVVDGLAPVLTSALQDPPADMADVANVRRALEAARPDLEAALDSLGKASALRASVEPARLSARGQRYHALLDSAEPRLLDVTRLGLRAPEIIAAVEGAVAGVEGLRQMPANPADLLRADMSLQEYQGRLARSREAVEHLDQLLSLEPAERGVLSFLPGIGGDLANLHGILSEAADMTRAAEIALGAVEPVFRVADGGLLGPQVAEPLEAALEAARAEFARARAVLGRQPENTLLFDDGLSPLAHSMVAQMASARSLLDQALAAAPGYVDALEDALGYRGPRTYLVLGVDEDEVRASGGFIGSVWEIKVERADITGLRFMYSPAVDDLAKLSAYPPPPAPLFKYLYAGYWLFRDAPWYADFPATVRVVQNLYEIGQGYTVDGVVVLVQKAMASAIGAIGPLELPGGYTVDADNLQEVLFWGIPQPPSEGVDLAPRVYAAKALGEATLGRLHDGLSPEAARLLAKAVVNSLRQKEVLLYSTDPRAQVVLRRFNWDGKLLSPPGDYLMVVDSNLYGGKVNGNLSQRLDYQINLGAGGPAQAQVTIGYHNQGRPQSRPCVQFEFDMEDTRHNCYWDYLRVYVPGDAEVTSAPEMPLPKGSLYYRAGFREPSTFTASNSEGDKLVLAGFFVVPPAEEKTVTISYQLGPGVVTEASGGRRQYRLTVQKQPGTVAMPLRVAVSFPTGWMVVGASPSGYSAGPGYVTFEVRLDADTQFSITFQP